MDILKSVKLVTEADGIFRLNTGFRNEKIKVGHNK